MKVRDCLYFDWDDPKAKFCLVALLPILCSALELNTFFENAMLVLFSLTLVYFSRDNRNLQSLLVLMMIPMLIDIIFLTPITKRLLQTELQHLYYVFHGMNDLLMIFLITQREHICRFIGLPLPFRRLKEEYAIIAIYFVSILTFVISYYELTNYMVDNSFDAQFILHYYEPIKRYSGWAECLILLMLTAQTFIIGKRLRKQGLID